MFGSVHGFFKFLNGAKVMSIYPTIWILQPKWRISFISFKIHTAPPFMAWINQICWRCWPSPESEMPQTEVLKAVKILQKVKVQAWKKTEHVNNETREQRGRDTEESRGTVQEDGRGGEIREVHVRGEERQKVRMGAKWKCWVNATTNMRCCCCCCDIDADSKC